MDMHTELTAVPHAGLGYHFLRVQVRTTGSWGSSKGSGAKSASRGRNDRVTTERASLRSVKLNSANVSAQHGIGQLENRSSDISLATEASSLDCHFCGQTVPLLKQCKRIPVTTRGTHTCLPKGGRSYLGFR